MADHQQISDALQTINKKIAAAAVRAQRDGRGVTLIAVSKTQTVGTIEAALAAGQRHFGENRLQEAMRKWGKLRALHKDIVLHLIGPLQTNKVKEAVAFFDTIHSLDRLKLAAKLADEMRAQDRRPNCFVEVNIGREPQKSGLAPGDLDSFLAVCRENYRLPIIGLMCIPPEASNPAPYFQELTQLAHRYQLPCLSMGMSADYEAAIAAGATHVRVGSALFGARPTK